MSQLYRILYCSRNCLSGSPDTYLAEVEAILAKSRANNGRDGVTGGLLFSDGCFAQVLEGPLEQVETTFERIQCDERHQDVTVLQAGPIDAREFGDWSMAFTGTAAGDAPLVKGTLTGALTGQDEAGAALVGIMRQVTAQDDWLLSA